MKPISMLILNNRIDLHLKNSFPASISMAIIYCPKRIFYELELDGFFLMETNQNQHESLEARNESAKFVDNSCDSSVLSHLNTLD